MATSTPAPVLHPSAWNLGFEPSLLRFDKGSYLEVKDPCPVHDGEQWHLFGTAVTAPHRFEVLHATAPALGGRWKLRRPVSVQGIAGSCVAAPGVIAEGSTLHMFLQTDYNALGGRIEHLRSSDGDTFAAVGTALASFAGTDEAGIYDPHPAEVNGAKYLVYSAFSVVGEPDLHLAQSASGAWEGPWTRRGPILRHDEVPFHNPRGDDAYEWGLEGGQLVELPDGRVLLCAACFLHDSPAGARQRVFLAISDRPEGPFEPLGPAIATLPGAENGHATAIVDGERIALFHQRRRTGDPLWEYALARGEIPPAEETPR